MRTTPPGSSSCTAAGGRCFGPPNPSPTSYQYTYNLGAIGTPEAVAGYTRFFCPMVFPISGCVSDFNVGMKMQLQESFGPYTQSFPVQVIAGSSTSWSFEAEPGHPEGPGRTIAFAFSTAPGCSDVQLNVYTSSIGSAATQWWGLRGLDFLAPRPK